jgi:CarD family transcriptional regulator
MAVNKTTKTSAKPKAKPPARGKAEAVKKVAAKAKTTAKAPAKTNIVPKVAAKVPAALVHGKSAKGPIAVKPAKTAPRIETNSKKSIVSPAAQKISKTKPVTPAAKIKAAPGARPPVAAAKPIVPAKAPSTAPKPVAARVKVASAAKPEVAPAAMKVAVPVKPAAQPQGKSTPVAPAIVQPLSKLPPAGKPGTIAAKPVAAAAKAAVAQAKPVPANVQLAAVVDPKKPVKPATQRHGFRTNEYIVYPSHGVGKIVRIEEQVVAGYSLELFVIHFEQEKMTLRVPTAKLASVGMRKLSENPIVERAMETLKGRARIKRTMWSRRAQEYEAKINSGDLVSIAEVVRDLYRAETQPEQSYSERQLFEAALDRMSREIAAIENLDDRGATQKVLDVLAKSAKNRKAAEAAPEAAVVATGGAERAA